MTSRKAEANASVESNADREAREARIRRLQTELAALRQAAGVNDGLSPDRSDDDDDASLTTVKVPAAFEPTFLEAQRYVRRYFSSQEQDPSSASISIAGERYVLVRAASLSVEFVQLVKSLYIDKGEAEAQRAANNLLYDLAHAIGQADARAFRQKMKLESPIEALSAGPIHFAFAGWAFVDISADSNPSPDEDFLLLYEHPYSFESHSWLAKGERSGQPVCIMNAGYSSGWCEESFGLPLVAVETECMAAGGECCRFVMAPAGRIEEHVSRLASERGDPSAEATDGVAAEIPEFFFRKRLEDELREANESLEKRVVERTRELEAATSELRVLGSAIENATEGFVIMERREEDGEAVISFVNRGFSEITGMRDADVLGKSPDQLPVASDDRHLLVEIRDRLREGKSVDVEVTALRPDGTEYELEVHAMPADPEKQPAHRWVAILHDVSERKAHLEELQRQALHDELTGLPNRALLYDRIEHCIEGLDRHDKEYGLLLLDLDRFKEVNDTFGHYVGDVLLTKVAERLRQAVRGQDTIARLGGDEFAVLIEPQARPEEATALAKRLVDSLNAPFKVEGQSLIVNVSIGIVQCPRHGRDPDTLMRRADIAMYAAKERHAGFTVYDPSLDVNSPARIQMVSELSHNIDDEHLRLHYQPQVDLASGEVRKVEALLRWQHDDGRLLMPDEFLPLAETTNLIDAITLWVLRRAMKDCSKWLEAGHRIGVSVNMAPRSLHDAHLPRRIARLLVAAHVPPEMLTLEITESSLLRHSLLADGVFSELRQLGIGLSIDDFGTGYSSLTHLKHLPFTELKIDRSFTRDIASSSGDAAIVRSSIELAHAFGRSVVAEGVEDQSALDVLLDYHCDAAQGFHYSKALPEEEFLAWLASRQG